MLCQGQILPIQQYAALFSILGTQYGGNGTTNFQLPNIQGQVLIGQGQLTGGSFYVPGETGGSASVAINSTTMPMHNHTFSGATAPAGEERTGDTNKPAASVSLLTNPLAKPAAGGNVSLNVANKTAPNTTMAPTMLSATGGGQPHENQGPYLTITYCISMQGQFPTRS